MANRGRGRPRGPRAPAANPGRQKGAQAQNVPPQQQKEPEKKEPKRKIAVGKGPLDQGSNDGQIDKGTKHHDSYDAHDLDDVPALPLKKTMQMPAEQSQPASYGCYFYDYGQMQYGPLPTREEMEYSRLSQLELLRSASPGTDSTISAQSSSDSTISASLGPDSTLLDHQASPAPAHRYHSDDTRVRIEHPYSPGPKPNNYTPSHPPRHIPKSTAYRQVMESIGYNQHAYYGSGAHEVQGQPSGYANKPKEQTVKEATFAHGPENTPARCPSPSIELVLDLIAPGNEGLIPSFPVSPEGLGVVGGLTEYMQQPWPEHPQAFATRAPLADIPPSARNVQMPQPWPEHPQAFAARVALEANNPSTRNVYMTQPWPEHSQTFGARVPLEANIPSTRNAHMTQPWPEHSQALATRAPLVANTPSTRNAHMTQPWPEHSQALVTRAPLAANTPSTRNAHMAQPWPEHSQALATRAPLAANTPSTRNAHMTQPWPEHSQALATRAPLTNIASSARNLHMAQPWPEHPQAFAARAPLTRNAPDMPQPWPECPQAFAASALLTSPTRTALAYLESLSAPGAFTDMLNPSAQNISGSRVTPLGHVATRPSQASSLLQAEGVPAQYRNRAPLPDPMGPPFKRLRRS